MKVFFTKKKWREFRGQITTTSIGFVPTMGALHQGHLELVKQAKLHADFIVVSIFVNPKQFNQVADLNQYPKTLKEDLEQLNDLGVDAVFLPTENEMYPEDDTYKAATPGIAAHGLEGAFRPGHFEGVVNVVDRLFVLIEPHWVFFGQKDLQQCMVLQELAQLKFPQLHFRVVETVRESSGLAMSSRNSRLSEEARLTAAAIFQVLNRLKLAKSNVEDEDRLLESLGIKVEYLEHRKLRITTNTGDYSQAWLFAGYLEGVRLIDNVIFN